MSERNQSEDARILALIAERTRGAAANRAARTAEQAAPPAPEEDLERRPLVFKHAGDRAGTPAPAAAPAAADAEPETAAIRFLRAAPPPPPSPVRDRARVTTPDGPSDRNGRGLFFGMVILPLILVAVYLVGFSTPLYEARAVISITKPADGDTGSQAGLLGGLDESANLQEVFRADTYIKSQALMDGLEEELGFVTELRSPAIDPVQRLRTLPLLSVSLHDQFDRYVESWIDLQSGLLTLYVRAPSPERAIEVSDTVLRKAEAQVHMLGETLFETRQSYAAEMRAEAEVQVQRAQARLVELQFRHQEVDPRNRVEGIYAQIRELEDEAQRLTNEIQKSQIAGFGDSPQTEKLVALEAHIQSEIARERERLVMPAGGSATPLNNVLMEYEMAVLEVELAREAVKSAIEAEAQAGREATLNRSVLQVVVPPITAGTPAYPRIPGILLLCLVICLAAYAAVVGFVKSRA